MEKLNKIITPIDKNYENLPLEDQQEIYRLFYDKEIAKDLRQKLRKIIFRLEPPTPQQYLDYTNGWITKPFQDSVLDHVKEDFCSILDHKGILDQEKNYDQIVEYGATRCHAKDQEILMYDLSLKKVQDIQIGDLLMGDDNTPRKVLELYKGYGKLYEIHQNKADNYIVNEDHILVLQYTNEGTNKDGKIIEISVKDYLNKSKYEKQLLGGIKSQCLPFKKNPIPIDPYFLAIWLGDGTSRNISITTKDKEIKNYLYKFSQKENLQVKVECYNYTNCKTYYINSGIPHGKKNRNFLLTKFKKLNLIQNKHIPMCYIKNSEEIRLQLLAGLLDTDGCYIKKSNHFTITQKNKKLINDIELLCRTLGFRVLKRKTIHTYKNFKGIYYELNIYGEVYKIPCKILRKKAICKKKIRNPRRTGIKVTEKENGDYYGFELNGNKKYLLKDFTITHNTGKSYMSRMLIHYIIIFIHCLRHPQLFYGLAPTTPLSVFILSFVTEKVNQLLLDPLYKVFEMSPRFKKVKFQDQVKERQEIEGLENIIWSKAGTGSEITVESGLTLNIGTDYLSFIGSNLLFLTVSEINFFIEKAGATHEQIFQLYTDALARIQATVGSNYLGMVFLDSSANDLENPIEQYILKDLQKQPKVFFRHRAKWEDKNGIRKIFGSSKFPKWLKTGETFKISIGNNSLPAKIIENNKELKNIPKNILYDIPIDLKGNFERNILKAIKDDLGLPTKKENKFIQDPEIIEKLFDNKTLINIEHVLIADASELPQNLLWDKIKTLYFGKYTQTAYVLKRAHKEARFVGFDLAHAIKGDIQGIAMLHMEWSRKLRKIMYIYDFCFGIIGKDTGINLEALTYFIIDLVEIGGVWIYGAYGDHFQSQTLIQALTRHGILAVKQSVDKIIEPYQTFFTYSINEQIKSGKNIYIKNNLDSLVTTKRNGKQVIDHSQGKTENTYTGNWNISKCGVNAKDVSDGGCQAFWGAVNSNIIPTTIYEDENLKFSPKEDKRPLIANAYGKLHQFY